MTDKNPATETSEAISPFVFKKINLNHLEIDMEIVLKFRKATFLDNEKMREDTKDVNYLVEMLQDPVSVAKALFNFLSRESKEELLKIKFTRMDDKTGEVTEVKHDLDHVFLMIFVASVEGHKDLMKTYLKVYGWEDDQIGQIMGEKEIQKPKTQKKTQKVTPKKKR